MSNASNIYELFLFLFIAGERVRSCELVPCRLFNLAAAPYQSACMRVRVVGYCTYHCKPCYLLRNTFWSGGDWMFVDEVMYESMK